MKIALVRHMMDDPQGGARLVAWLARDLRELGEDVTLYCYGYDRARCFPDILADVPVKWVRRLDGGDSGPRGGREIETGSGRVWAQLRRYFREAPRLAALLDERSDVVNPHEWLAHRGAALFGLPHRVPIVWTYNDPSHWHVQSGWGGGPIELAYRALGWFDTRQVNRFAAVTTLSQWMAEIGARAFAVPIEVVRCGVDVRAVSRAEGALRERPRDGVLRLLSVGILDPWRRLEDAIRAVAAVHSQGRACHYEIIGSDRFWPSYGAMLRGLVTELGVGDAVTLRFESIDDAELEAAYAKTDIAIFPNERQAWGLAQLEAMARAIPVIVSRGAGVSEVLRDGTDALLVDARRPDQIEQMIRRLDVDDVLRRSVAERGRALVLGSYTSMHYARRMLDLFRTVTARG